MPLTTAVLVLTAVALSSGVTFILSLGTVNRPITQLIHGDTQARGRTGPFSWVTLTLHIICRQNELIIFECPSLHIKKGQQHLETMKAESFACLRL